MTIAIRALAGGVRQRVEGEDRSAEIEDRDEQEQEDRDDQGELNECLTAATPDPVAVEEVHSRFTTMLLLHGTLDPPTMDWDVMT